MHYVRSAPPLEFLTAILGDRTPCTLVYTVQVRIETLFAREFIRGVSNAIQNSCIGELYKAEDYRPVHPLDRIDYQQLVPIGFLVFFTSITYHQQVNMHFGRPGLGFALSLLSTAGAKKATEPNSNHITGLSPAQSSLLCDEASFALAVFTHPAYTSSAYSFCSSFIHIPKVTSTVTNTLTSFTPTTTTV